MVNLVLKTEALNKVMEGKEITKNDIKDIFNNSENIKEEIFKTSQAIRKRNKGNYVTFSKKAFFNVINLCKDTCSYCTYKAEPEESKLSMMSKDSFSQILQLARKYRCTEALLVTGERPELRYKEARSWLREMGYKDTSEYLVSLSEAALAEGLFPHTNAGNLTKKELIEISKTNVSVGLMLENVSNRLTERDMPHFLATSKNPKNRIAVLEDAGSVGIPTTTGILVGIGETPEEVIESIYAIKEISEKYGHIQEVIIQNFQPKADTFMNSSSPAEEEYFMLIVALARIIMPHMNIQIPPNLSPNSYHRFLSIGINDWGGISPLTPDYVNPEFSWPKINKIEANTKKAGFELKARFPVYPEFFSLLPGNLKERVMRVSDTEGYVIEERWR